jgi:hypothetical protein
MTMKVIKSVKLVTFAMNAMSPVNISTRDRAPQIIIAVHGICLPGWTDARKAVSGEDEAIPKRRRDEASWWRQESRKERPASRSQTLHVH